MKAATKVLAETVSRFDETDRVSEEVRSVVLCAAGAEQERLAKLIEQLNYRVIVDRRGRATASLDAVPVAAIVSDTLPDVHTVCERFARACPVVLVSDKTDFRFRLAGAKVGTTGVIRRPVNPIEMGEWLSSLSDHESTQAFSVLIVDDDWLTAEVSAEVLRSVGIRVRTVDRPALALQAIEEDTPDLVLMDVQMPDVSGLELTRVIRQARQFVSLPIIFLSAERDEGRQMEARRLGGDDFIAKPISPERLISLVRLRADRSRHLRALIERDRLTGLYNAVTFKERLALELDRCRRTGGELSLAMIDIDFFKNVNDTHGHLMGDHVLRTLASNLTTSLRRTDVVGRCGGEEFGVVLVDSGSEAAALAIDRIRTSFAQIGFGGVGETQFGMTFSAGIASSRWSGDQVSDLIFSADSALYDCKRSGRNKVAAAPVPFQPDLYPVFANSDLRSIACNR